MFEAQVIEKRSALTSNLRRAKLLALLKTVGDGQRKQCAKKSNQAKLFLT
jgi:hypothetical protein